MQVNFSSPAFGSTYKFDYSKTGLLSSIVTTSLVQRFCEDNECYFGMQKFEPNAQGKIPLGTIGYVSAVLPDSLDMDFEQYCKCNAIKYTKHQEDHMSEGDIIARTKLPEYTETGAKLCLLDVDKFEQLLPKHSQLGNYDHCENMYNLYFKDKADGAVKSNLTIQPTNLYIMPLFEGVKEYVERFGVENLNPDSIIFDFNQQDEFDHCIYFAMKNAGMTHIPVQVSQDSYEFGKILGLFK